MFNPQPKPIKPPKNDKIIIKGKTRIKPMSTKRQREEAEYRLLRRAFLMLYPNCEVNREGCTGGGHDVHHMKGRGKYLLDVTYFKATCRSCHKWVEENGAKAIELGFSVSRLQKISYAM